MKRLVHLVEGLQFGWRPGFSLEQSQWMKPIFQIHDIQSLLLYGVVDKRPEGLCIICGQSMSKYKSSSQTRGSNLKVTSREGGSLAFHTSPTLWSPKNVW